MPTSRGARRNPPYIPPTWEHGVDLVAETSRHAVDERLAPALQALLESQGIDERTLAPAAGLDRKYIKAILAGRSTPSPEALDDLISGFSRRAVGLVAPEYARWTGFSPSRDERREQRSREFLKLATAAAEAHAGQVGHHGRASPAMC